jgi:hypothetical protein
MRSYCAVWLSLPLSPVPRLPLHHPALEDDLWWPSSPISSPVYLIVAPPCPLEFSWSCFGHHTSDTKWMLCLSQNQFSYSPGACWVSYNSHTSYLEYRLCKFKGSAPQDFPYFRSQLPVWDPRLPTLLSYLATKLVHSFHSLPYPVSGSVTCRTLMEYRSIYCYWLIYKASNLRTTK